MKTSQDKVGMMDGAAAAMSSLCLLHCLALPAALALLPMVSGSLGEALHGPEWLHWAMILLALPFSIQALWRGYESHHQRLPVLLAAVGFVAMGVGALVHGHGSLEVVLTVGGGLFVAVAHWLNWRARMAHSILSRLS